MLVAIVIGAMLVSLAALSLRPDPHRALRQQAERLALLFETAADEAQLGARPLRWQSVKGGYRFLVRDGEQWRVLHDDLLRPRAWEGEVRSATVRVPGEAARAELLFGTESIGEPAGVTLVADSGTVRIVTRGDGRYEVAP